MADRRPNIVFIMADDHAAHAIGAYGSAINETPGIDRIARDEVGDVAPSHDPPRRGAESRS